MKTIAVTYGRKFNLGHYNSLVIETSAWADLDEDVDVQSAYAEIFEELRGVVKEQALPILRHYQTTSRVTVETSLVEQPEDTTEEG